MLALTRKVGERILIGDDIYVVVVEIQGDRVRLGFSAPSDIPIDREEIRIDKESKRIDKTRR